MSLRKELKKAPTGALRLLVWPFYRLVSIVLAARGIRFFCIAVPDRIGHLAIEPDCYLKDIELGRVSPARTVLLIKKGRVPANPCMLDYWRQFMPVLSNRLLVALLYPLRKHEAVWFDVRRYAARPKTAAGCYATYAAWGDRPPILKLDADHAARGEEALREMGIPDGAWFVCVHSREPGYALHDDHVHEHRNSAIESYLPAMREIVARGGWCVRMGEPSSPPLKPMPGVIDYRHSPLRSDWMDIFLCARCRFFLGNTSGLFLVSSVFGVPVALAHMAPIGAVYALGPNDLSIPKMVVDVKGTVWPFAKMFRSDASRSFSAEAFARSGLRVVDNSGEEIRDLATEMMDRLDGRAKYTDEDERLQAAFRRLPGADHYSYGAVARIGRDFLRRHADLLMDERKPMPLAAGDAR
jgi:putative glycosyltransferase (TIGR04372 family)